MANKWSYKRVDLMSGDDTGQLICDIANAEGVNGWEAIRFHHYPAYTIPGTVIGIFFKRKGADIPAEALAGLEEEGK